MLRLEFSVDADSGVCRLILDLAPSQTQDTRTLRAGFVDVSNLSIREFGGGLTQVVDLAVEDISDKQLDRIKYEVKELERESQYRFSAKR